MCIQAVSEAERDRTLAVDKLHTVQMELEAKVTELQRLRRDMTSQHGADCDVISRVEEELKNAKSAHEQEM